jgi:hypothetical protein
MLTWARFTPRSTIADPSLRKPIAVGGGIGLAASYDQGLRRFGGIPVDGRANSATASVGGIKDFGGWAIRFGDQ